MVKEKDPIPDIRKFNRFYTDIIGLLDKYLLHSAYSLAEGRIIFEIYSGKSVQASQIMTAMNIDKSYLSRLLKKLEKDGLITRASSGNDARAMLISLTEKGIQEFTMLNKASDKQISDLIINLNSTDQQELVANMNAIMNILKRQS